MKNCRQNLGFATLCAIGISISLSQLGCVLPNEKLSGVALSWSLFESGTIAETDTPTIRTCIGAGAESVEIHIQDLNDAERNRSWTFPCINGMSHPEDNATSQSDVFLELNPGNYAISLRAWGNELVGRTLLAYSDQEVAIESGVNSHAWAAPLLPLEFSIDLLNLNACQTIALRFEYADPEQDILFPQNPTPKSEQAPETIPSNYRPLLISDNQLVIDGFPHACSEIFPGVHYFVDIDRGSYQLTAQVDGRICTYPLVLEQRGSNHLQIDIANMNCFAN